MGKINQIYFLLILNLITMKDCYMTKDLYNRLYCKEGENWVFLEKNSGKCECIDTYYYNRNLSKCGKYISVNIYFKNFY